MSERFSYWYLILIGAIEWNKIISRGKEFIMFLTNSSLPSLSPSSILPTLTAQTHLQTQAHKLLPLNQCKMHSNEIQLIKN